MLELTRTRQLIDNIRDDMLLSTSQDICDKLSVSLCVNLPIHNTRSATANAELDLNHVKNTLNTLNNQLKLKLNEEFDAGDSEHYLDSNLLKKCASYFSCIEINTSILEIEIKIAKLDFNLGIPINKNRAKNLLKLISIKNTLATSTASVERAFSGMNRICSKLRSSITPEKLNNLLCVSMNKDILNELDINDLINKWSTKKNRRFII